MATLSRTCTLHYECECCGKNWNVSADEEHFPYLERNGWKWTVCEDCSKAIIWWERQ